jgi:hypothetical protein
MPFPHEVLVRPALQSTRYPCHAPHIRTVKGACSQQFAWLFGPNQSLLSSGTVSLPGGTTMPTSDREIRAALHRKKFRALHGRTDTLIIDELGLAHAKARIDIAAINGCVHGFEIKSAADTLARLPQQLMLYEQCLEKLTIVCAEKHVSAVRKMAPAWCGILKVTKGPLGGIAFIAIRPPKRNPNVQANKLAHLLWRSEAVALLARLNAPPQLLRAPRKQLYDSLAAVLTIKQITAFIKESMESRQAWRDLPAHA